MLRAVVVKLQGLNELLVSQHTGGGTMRQNATEAETRMIDSAALLRAAKNAKRKTALPGVLDAAAMQRRQVARLRIGLDLIDGLTRRIAELEAAMSGMEKTSVRLEAEAVSREPETEAQAPGNAGIATASGGPKFFWKNRMRSKINSLVSLLDARLASFGKYADKKTAKNESADGGLVEIFESVETADAKFAGTGFEYAETEAAEAEFVEAVLVESAATATAAERTAARAAAGAKTEMGLAEVLVEIMPAANPRVSAASAASAAISVSAASALVSDAERLSHLSAIEKQLQRELARLAFNLQKQKAR